MQVRQINIEGFGESASVVDAPTAQELLTEIHRRATREQLDGIVGALERKVERFAQWLTPAALRADDGVAVRDVLRHIFATRRRVSVVLGSQPAEAFGARVEELLWGADPLADRIDAFCEEANLPPLVAAELAAELLRYGDPSTHWLWSRWIWNPQTRTGALPLVVGEDFDLEADGLGATYVRVGEAIRFLDESPEAASFRPSTGGTLGTDVFLAGVFSVYASTVLGLKLSQEFNAVIPPLPELARRLLGVHRMGQI